MTAYEIIDKKAQGYELTPEEIEFFITEYTADKIPDYQASALLMAIRCKGMTDAETAALTDIMARSGDMLCLDSLGEHTVDKHSTGGVGDKTTLIVAPIVASLGCRVAKMSGRGLGHTGGTIDKLESIPEYRVTLSQEEFFECVKKTGVAVVGQSGHLAPADKRLYALRDVTATVKSLPLIVSSIMSKKLAAGSKSIVLDVKTGSGAFMTEREDAERLAESMVAIGKRCGRNMAAVLTDMDKPLGRAVGNALEVKEAVSVLKGEVKNDLYTVSLTLAALMVSLARGIEYDEAFAACEECVSSGRAFGKMKEWVEAQGGDSRALEWTDLLPGASYSFDIIGEEGYIGSMNAEKIGRAAMLLGAGRAKKDDVINHGAGLILHKKTGDYVKKGETVCTLYADDENLFSAAAEEFVSAVRYTANPPEKTELILKIIR